MRYSLKDEEDGRLNKLPIFLSCYDAVYNDALIGRWLRFWSKACNYPSKWQLSQQTEARRLKRGIK